MHYLKKTVTLPEDEDEEYNTNSLDKLNKITNQDQLNESSDNKDTVSNQQLQFKNHHAIKLPDTTEGVLKKIKAAIYLNMCQYWDFPKEITLLLALLDPRHKKLKFVTEQQCNVVIDKLNELYRIEQAIILEESNNSLFVDLSESLATNEFSNIDQVNYSLFKIYEDSDDNNDNMSNEVVRYLTLPKEAPKYNILEW
ncbi:5754_t:CDS:1 [Cetraspora pellucida]|uniref:5754_t:CDS:1 n=1 Tax=Cetraspora pellucida TaxID=1433469 RepID=A0A9N8WAS7_9GLOM|nr:5754_t:CDS:1 [Cetraspora pellucida]